MIWWSVEKIQNERPLGSHFLRTESKCYLKYYSACLGQEPGPGTHAHPNNSWNISMEVCSGCLLSCASLRAVLFINHRSRVAVIFEGQVSLKMNTEAAPQVTVAHGTAQWRTREWCWYLCHGSFDCQLKSQISALHWNMASGARPKGSLHSCFFANTSSFGSEWEISAHAQIENVFFSDSSGDPF